MSSDAPRASSAGVSSLRAMFESQRSATDSPDRGRTPSGSSNGESGRKLSKIRSSFVTVEPNAQLAKSASTQSNGPSEVSIANRERRESFSMNKEEDAEAVEEIHKAISKEEEKRNNSADIKEAVPETAIETGPAGLGTPVLTPTDRNLEPLRNNVRSRPSKNNMKMSPPSPAKELDAQSPPPVTSSPPAEVLQNLANNLRTPSQPQLQKETNGKAAVVESTPEEEPTIVTPEPPAPTGAASEPATPPTVEKNGKETPSEIVTSTGDLQTSPGGVSPTVLRHLLVPPEMPGPEQHDEQLRAIPEPTGKAAAKRQAAPPSAKKTATSSATTTRSPRPSRSTPNFKNNFSASQSGYSSRKPPTVAVAPKFSSSTRYRDTTNRTSNASTSTTSGVTSGIGFHKPRPKTPTRPLKLPSHLLAPTVSFAAKHGEQPPPSPTASSTRDRSRRPSTISERGTKPTLMTSQLGRKPSARPQAFKSSLGPPPQKREPEQKPKREARPPDEGFLARMMRPTAASAGKAREQKELELLQVHLKRNAHHKNNTTAASTATAPTEASAVDGRTDNSADNGADNGADNEAPEASA